MCSQRATRIVASQPQAVSVFKKNPRIVSECSGNTRNSFLEEAGPELVFAKQGVTRWAGHVAITVTLSSCFTKSAFGAAEIPGLLRICVLECV